MSLFAVGGALSAIPEMHRIAVDVNHWMSDRQFADMVAIAQLSPGPNVLVVTLIGFHVAGVAGGLVATLAHVRADCRGCLFREPYHGAIPRCAMAAADPVGAGSASPSG